jgi:ribosomal protein S18 acetylase RimI-like enzyme
LSLGFKVESRQENFFGDGEPRLVLARRGDHG